MFAEQIKKIGDDWKRVTDKAIHIRNVLQKVAIDEHLEYSLVDDGDVIKEITCHWDGIHILTNKLHSKDFTHMECILRFNWFEMNDDTLREFAIQNNAYRIKETQNAMERIAKALTGTKRENTISTIKQMMTDNNITVDDLTK